MVTHKEIMDALGLSVDEFHDEPRPIRRVLTIKLREEINVLSRKGYSIKMISGLTNTTEEAVRRAITKQP